MSKRISSDKIALNRRLFFASIAASYSRARMMVLEARVARAHGLSDAYPLKAVKIERENVKGLREVRRIHAEAYGDEQSETLAERAARLENERDAMVMAASQWAAELAEVEAENERLAERLSRFEEAEADTLSEFPAAAPISNYDVSDFGMVGE